MPLARSRSPAKPAKKAPKRSPPKRGPRAPRWLEEGARLAALLTERGLGKTEFGVLVGRPFHTVHRWCIGFEFGVDNQAEAARALGVPVDTFEAPDAATRRKRRTRAVLAAFRASSPFAVGLTDAEWYVLESIAFFDDSLAPSVAFYETVSAALRGAIRVDEIMAVSDDNSALDAALAHKPPLKKR